MASFASPSVSAAPAPLYTYPPHAAMMAFGATEPRTSIPVAYAAAFAAAIANGALTGLSAKKLGVKSAAVRGALVGAQTPSTALQVGGFVYGGENTTSLGWFLKQEGNVAAENVLRAAAEAAISGIAGAYVGKLTQDKNPAVSGALAALAGFATSAIIPVGLGGVLSWLTVIGAFKGKLP